MRTWSPIFAVAAVVFAADPPDFRRDIEPVLRNRCHGCHGAATQMSGLRLDSREAMLSGGNSGPAVVAGNSSASKLIRLVAGLEANKVMPPAGQRLTAQEIAHLRNWIDEGAVWTGSGEASIPAAQKPAHWSNQPVARPKPPQTRNQSWSRNAIDRFVLARLERESIAPSTEADKRTLIRRVSLDLIGLPPEPEAVEVFIRDNRTDAYERVVDRLLESPHYGERWARHWLDLARYADSDGYEKDYVRPHAWRWRHWVIDSFNQDKPFDRFTVEQIAGDLLPGAGIDQRVATGFHRNTLTNREGGVNIEQFRVEQVVDRASTVGTVWLGLTLGCAQCHDHKFDPVSQKNFYEMYAFFNSADERNIDAPLDGEMGPFLKSYSGYRRKRDELLKRYGVSERQAQWEARMKEARANPGRWTDWDHACDAFQKYLDHADEILDMPADKRPPKWADDIADHFIINYHRVIGKDEWKALKYTDLRKELDALKEKYPALSEAPIIAEDASVRRASHIHVRGDWRRKGAAVRPGVPGFLHAFTAESPTRMDLANWLVDPANPLTARVTVNRYWQEFFGRGIVLSSDDFGSRGERPSHPELLDWLAGQFIDSGWRVKALHRLIVTSATYRQSSHARPEVDSRNSSKDLFARQVRLRLPSEAVRDAALYVSALLYPAVGGKSVRPPIPAGVVDLSYAGSVKWPESAGPERYRRGMYILYQRTVPYPMLVNFDQPDASVPACRRERSNTPLQALNLLNDPVFVEAAQALALRALNHPAPDKIDRLFRISLMRSPNAQERGWVESYLREQTARFEENPKHAEEFFPAALPGRSRGEFAAWAALASVLLNTDEFITRE